ncbi:hypothetical protein HOY82DRAFT_178058 [Tuber indicum]|nr:hypothetical protein HOY82DRAFT_178058 [Tuber indicum]
MEASAWGFQRISSGRGFFPVIYRFLLSGASLRGPEFSTLNLQSIHRHPTLSVFFSVPLFFIWTMGFSYFSIFISLIKKQCLCFVFLVPHVFPISSGSFAVHVSAFLLLCVHQFLLVKYTLLVHMGSFSCISFFQFCFC